ncbi:hypothetical protein VTG60DRAFT_6877 [Thermothelomyces hinnuleus]
MSEAAEREAAFFAGDFGAAVAAADFAGEDTVAAGEIGALPRDRELRGRDAIFCEPPRERCEAILRETAAVFPDARSYDYYAPPNTGHDLTLHHSAADTADRIHDWLDSKVLGGETGAWADI